LADQGKPDSSTKLLTNASHSDNVSTTSSSAQTKKSSSTKRTCDEAEVQDSQGSVASAQKKRKTKNTDAPAEVANVVMRLRGGGDSPHNSDGDEDFNDDSDSNWKHSDSYGKTQGDMSEGEEDIRKVRGIADDNDFTFPSNEITDEDRALMTSMSSLSGSVTSLHQPNAEDCCELKDVSTNDLPFKTDTTLTPLKVDKGIQATPDEDDLVLAARNREKAVRELEFQQNSPLKKGYPTAVMNEHGVLTVDGLDIYQFGHMYGSGARDFGYEGHLTRRMRYRFEIFLDQVQTHHRRIGLPPINRVTMCDGLVEVADLLWEAREEII